MTAAAAGPRILIYLLRRDLRLLDNPVFHEISKEISSPSPSFTHVLPIYVFSAQQVEVSGFLRDSTPEEHIRSPYPPARSATGSFWRCGPHRAKFLAESVWDLKQSLQDVGSGLIIRVGMLQHVIKDALNWFDGNDATDNERRDSHAATERGEVVGVWMTQDETVEERREEREIRTVVEDRGKQFKLFTDEKYYIDDRDLPFDNIKDLPNIFTSFRHKLEPLRSRPRRPLPAPSELPFPPTTSTPPQADPFSIPDTLDGTLTALFAPLNEDLSHGLPDVPRWPSNTQSAHPFNGGETQAQERVWHLLSNGAMTSYKDTRNGLLGTEFSTKLAGFLSLGCVSARWVHAEMLEFEGRSDSIQQQPSKGNNDFTTKQGAGVPVNPNPVVSSTNFSPSRSAAISTRNPNEAQYKSRYHRAPGYDGGENPGTAGVRFELLWRDYMRLCARKFGSKLHHISGFVGAEDRAWKLLSHSTPGLGDDPNITKNVLTRFLEGRTGTSLIDAAQRELFLTGYTSNRARQNVASFLAKKLGIDWRVGAEWYECMLVDYDCASNWGNWQYVAGVGNDPRQGREFNPIKQALDYDKHGEYIKAWVPELRALDTVAKAGMGQGSGGGDRGQDQDPEALMGLFQAWRIGEREKEKLGLKGLDWVERPLRRIEFEVRRSGGGRGRGRGRGRGGPRGGRGSNAYGGRWRSGDMDKMREFDQRM